MAVSVKLDDDIQRRIKALAERKQRSPHWLMREAIRGYVEKEEAQQELLAEAEASSEHYRQTGLHITHEEMTRWLESWGSDDELDLPQCHS